MPSVVSSSTLPVDVSSSSAAKALLVLMGTSGQFQRHLHHVQVCKVVNGRFLPKLRLPLPFHCLYQQGDSRFTDPYRIAQVTAVASRKTENNCCSRMTLNS